ncbi:MAG TPA: MOSC domain-containing protein, partial [Planctomycetota bacterium]|nr:MOSC domain-containing protein [Planctomycetota bacterium]
GPHGEPDRYLALDVLQAGLAALAPAPRDAGRLALIVCRMPDGSRTTPASVRVTPQDGVHGDGWSRRPPRNVEAQVTVVRRDVAELVANGQPLTHFGDNLFVDLDIADANLPAGSRVRIGDALLEVTAKPHNGCLKYKDRFGEDALRFVQAPGTRDRNLRGLHWKVIEAGTLHVGARIDVVSRPGG